MNAALQFLDFNDVAGEKKRFTVIERNPPMFGPKSKTRVKFKRGLYVRGGRLLAIAALLPRGLTDDEIVMAADCNVATVRKLRRALEEESGKQFLCPCGQRAGHSTFCCVRRRKPHMYRLTPDRVRFIRRNYEFRKHGIDKLARQLNVPEPTIYDALVGNSWAHIQDPGPIIAPASNCKRHRLRPAVAALLQQGCSAYSIAKQIGMTKGEVLRIRKLEAAQIR